MAAPASTDATLRSEPLSIARRRHPNCGLVRMAKTDPIETARSGSEEGRVATSAAPACAILPVTEIAASARPRPAGAAPGVRASPAQREPRARRHDHMRGQVFDTASTSYDRPAGWPAT